MRRCTLLIAVTILMTIAFFATSPTAITGTTGAQTHVQIQAALTPTPTITGTAGTFDQMTPTMCYAENQFAVATAQDYVAMTELRAVATGKNDADANLANYNYYINVDTRTSYASPAQGREFTVIRGNVATPASQLA